MNLQPLLHNETVILRAPVQAWSAPDGTIGSRPVHGVYVGDVRALSHVSLTVGDHAGEHIATVEDAVDAVTFVSLLRHLDDGGADPRVRALHTRSVTGNGVRERVRIESTLSRDVSTTVRERISADLIPMDVVKSGRSVAQITMSLAEGGAAWRGGSVRVELDAPGARTSLSEGSLWLEWDVSVPAKGAVEVGWSALLEDEASVVGAPDTPAPWLRPEVPGDDRLRRWVDRALDDLDALRLTTTRLPGEEFFAAGSPWFFTLFGRDSIWAARMLLPIGHRMAASTLRVLAAFQGRSSVPPTAEQPGKIMHELRRDALDIPGEAISLPPLYYGTVDATPLWACLLHDAWRAGMPEEEVAALLPALESALEWMRDFGDSDGDGLLEYVDETGHGLSNQGWKDSGDSVQWNDGPLARGPIALCEVQAYAFEAAMHGADLLDHFGRDGEPWRGWARRLKERFDASFWIDDPAGAYPGIALDADKRAVDTVTSNLGHLLGTGLLDASQAELVARRLLSPEMNSGYGLRTMSTASAGYWPLSYHGGSVWAHDTAIAIRGLAAEGFDPGPLADGLLTAAVAFDYRMPELHSGDAANSLRRPVPYPAACRPQAWAAAAAIAVWDALR